MAHFSIAGLQLELDNRDNLYLMKSEIEAAKSRFPWLDMVLLSELNAFGSVKTDAQPLPGEAEQFFCDIAARLKIWLIPGSLYESRDKQIFNTAPVINPAGKVIARYRKMFPFQPYETGVSCGNEFVVFDVPEVGRFGVSICYDSWFPETTRTLVSMGAEVIIHPSMTNTIDRDIELAIVRASAATNQCYFIDINVAGRIGNGRSVIAGPGGEIIYQAGEGRDIIPVELDLDYVRRVRKQGWHGLGQMLKSFRDSKVRFPPYQDDRPKNETLEALGKLELPGPDSSRNRDFKN